MEERPISVVMPVYNGAKHLRECLDSILSQTFGDFELLIVDDGSTDNTCEIIESYNDARICLIRNKHDYIASCNLLLSEARGKYIARMDADDIMMPDRLAYQYEYMESHPDVSVTGGAFIPLNDENFKPVMKEYDYTLNLLLKGNYIVNPTSMCKKEDILKNQIHYSEDFIYAEDYHFWSQMLLKGLVVRILPKVLVKYRFSAIQTTSRHRRELLVSAQKVKKQVGKYLAAQMNSRYVEPVIRDSDKKLTVIIPFLNEGEEVLNTVKSIEETAGNSVDIIVCNDQSTDGYNYIEALNGFDNVYYFFNEERKGVAASRDYCISLCKTPYFLLLDGHMRFYSYDWSSILISLLEKDERVLLCCQGKPLQKENGIVSVMPDVPTCFGALLPFVENRLTDIEWRYDETSKENIEEIPAVLGAGYAASKHYWMYLKGLNGLRSYGSDEQYISLKVWVEGGKCLLVKNIIIGHVYRKSSPFERYVADEFFNKILISYLFFPLSWRCRLLANLMIQDIDSFQNALHLMKSESIRIQELIDYQHKIQKRTLSDFLILSKKLCPSKTKEKTSYIQRLKSIAEFLQNEEIETAGISQGAMGHIIWFSHYNDLYPDKNVTSQIDVLWQFVLQNIEDKLLPMNFKHGLLGIGWGLLYLSDKGFLDDSPDSLLVMIDKEIQLLNVRNIQDESLHFGLGGILVYVNARIQYALNLSNIAKLFSDTFLDSLLYRVNVLLEMQVTEPCIVYHALKFKALLSDNENKEDFKLDCAEWMKYKNFIPVNLKYGERGLEGNIMSSSLHAMLLNKK